MLAAESSHGDSASAKHAYQDFLAVRDAILKFKWIASEQAGHDIGFESALLGWQARQRKSAAASQEKASSRKSGESK